MRLITFGDSWTAGHGVEEEFIYKEEPNPPQFFVKLREQNSWPRWLSTKYEIPYINLGGCGWGNDWILNYIKDCVNKSYIKKDDLVIVTFSYPYRYSNKNKYTPYEILIEIHKLLKKYNHFFFNGFYPLLKDENVNGLFIPNTFIEPSKTLADVLKEYEIKNNESVWEYGSRSVWNDTKNYWEGDYHPNLNGYKIIAEYIYSELNSFDKSSNLI